jgi:hypothetical protein
MTIAPDGSCPMTPDPHAMTFPDALDILIAVGVSSLRSRDTRLRKALQVAVNYRSLEPERPGETRMTREQLDTLARWMMPAAERGGEDNGQRQ